MCGLTGIISFPFSAHFPPAALLFVLGYTGCDPAAPAALYTAALALTGATPAGAYSSAADIAPNFAGTYRYPLISIYICRNLKSSPVK